jgi:hypothetical protein
MSAGRPDGLDLSVLKTKAGILAPTTSNTATTSLRRDLGEHQRRAPTRAGRTPKQAHRHHLSRLRIARELARERLARIERQLVHPQQILLEYLLRPLEHGGELRTFEPARAADLEQLDDRRQRSSVLIGVEAFGRFEGDPEGRRLDAGLSLLVRARQQGRAQRQQRLQVLPTPASQIRPPSERRTAPFEEWSEAAINRSLV